MVEAATHRLGVREYVARQVGLCRKIASIIGSIAAAAAAVGDAQAEMESRKMSPL
jgi:hypothetical protein